MKKTLLTTSILFTAMAGAYAQTGPLSGTTELGVIIKPIHSIFVNHASVNLVYSNIDAYKNGVQANRPAHLTVNSTGSFQVKVSASDLESTVGDKTIAASGIKITASEGATTGRPVSLSNSTDKIIFSSTKGGFDRKLDVLYQGPSGNTYIDNFFKEAGELENVYKTTLTYSIEAK